MLLERLDGPDDLVPEETKWRHNDYYSRHDPCDPPESYLPIPTLSEISGYMYSILIGWGLSYLPGPLVTAPWVT